MGDAFFPNPRSDLARCLEAPFPWTRLRGFERSLGEDARPANGAELFGMRRGIAYIINRMAILHADKERWRLAQRYASMTEIEVKELAAEAESLSDAAKWALRVDLSRRGLHVQLAEPAPVPKKNKKEHSRIVSLLQYMTLPEALLAKSLLDSAGIESFLGDQNIIRMDWFLANALGGVKLRVREEDAEEAAALLGQGKTASAR